MVKVGLELMQCRGTESVGGWVCEGLSKLVCERGVRKMGGRATVGGWEGGKERGRDGLRKRVCERVIEGIIE